MTPRLPHTPPKSVNQNNVVFAVESYVAPRPTPSGRAGESRLQSTYDKARGRQMADLRIGLKKTDDDIRRLNTSHRSRRADTPTRSRADAVADAHDIESATRTHLWAFAIGAVLEQLIPTEKPRRCRLEQYRKSKADH